jgi:hypothetical protein
MPVTGRSAEQLLAELNAQGTWLPLAIERKSGEKLEVFPFHDGYEPAEGDTLLAARATSAETGQFAQLRPE